MLLPKRGFYHPTVLIILAAITLSVAVIFYINSKYLFKPPQPAQLQEPVASPPAPSQSVDETANWRTYRLTSRGYSIKHPREMEVTEEPLQISPNLMTEIKTTFEKGDGSLTIVANLGGTGVAPIKQEKSVISGIKTDKYYTSETEGVIKAIPSPSGDDIYFSFKLPKQNPEEFDNLIDQMLSTFKFSD